MHEYKKHEPLIQRLAKQLETPKAAPTLVQQGHQYIASAPGTPPQQTGVFFGQAPQRNDSTNPPTTPIVQDTPVAQAAPAASQPAPVNVQETMNPSDDLPSLFHHHYRKASGPLTNHARSIFVGVSSAFLLGVISLFFSPQNHSPSTSSRAPLMATSGPIDIFAGDTGIISAKAYMEQSDRMQQVTTIDFNAASIGSPLSNVATGPVGAEATLSQLEKTLAPPPVEKTRLALDSTGTHSGESAAPQKNNDHKMQQLTDQVVNALSGLNDTNNNNAPQLGQSVDQLRDSLANLVSEAQAQGKDAKSVEKLLKEALGKNQNKLPDALKGRDGRLDITTLIASVVKKAGSQNQGASNEDDYLSQIENEGRKTALSSRKLETKNGKRYLIVKPGDTLSSIAYTTYGDSFLYPKIFQANKKRLANPNALRIGMRLVIPK